MMHCGYFDTARKGITLLLWYQEWLVGDAPFRLKFALKLTQPFETRRLRQIFAYNVSTVIDSEKSSINPGEEEVDHGLSNEL